MSVKNVYITKDNESEVYIETGTYESPFQISLVIRDFKMDASSKSNELAFDRGTLKMLALEILKFCEIGSLTKKSNL